MAKTKKKVKRRRRKLQLVRLRKGNDPILKELTHLVGSMNLMKGGVFSKK